jgi:hypothetical protein
MSESLFGSRGDEGNRIKIQIRLLGVQNAFVGANLCVRPQGQDKRPRLTFVVLLMRSPCLPDAFPLHFVKNTVSYMYHEKKYGMLSFAATLHIATASFAALIKV